MTDSSTSLSSSSSSSLRADSSEILGRKFSVERKGFDCLLQRRKERMKTWQRDDEMVVKIGPTCEPSDGDSSNSVLSTSQFDLLETTDNEFEVAPAVDPEKRNFLLRVAGMMVDKDTNDTLNQVARVCSVFFADMEQTTTEAMVGLLSLSRLHSSSKCISSQRIEENWDVQREILHYWKFAAAAYGWKLLNSLMFAGQEDKIMRGFMKGNAENIDTLCKHTGINREDILSQNWSSSTFRPGHYLCIDHTTESLVLAFRGTFHVQDALADLIGVPTNFIAGQTHEGILNCAKTKVMEVRGLLREFMEVYPGYRLTVVGHSLGAGTAALSTLLLHHEFPTWDIHCYAFAPPCVLSLVQAWEASSLITSVILGMDVVPRISFESMNRLKRHCAMLVPHNKTSYVGLLSAGWTGSMAEKYKKKREALKNKDSSATALTNSASTGRKKQKKIKGEGNGDNSGNRNRKEEMTEDFDLGDPPNLDDSLFPPGTVYHLIKEDFPGQNGEELYRLEESHPSFFCDIKLVKSMFTDHLPWMYDQALRGMHLRSIQRSIERREVEREVLSNLPYWKGGSKDNT